MYSCFAIASLWYTVCCVGNVACPFNTGDVIPWERGSHCVSRSSCFRNSFSWFVLKIAFENGRCNQRTVLSIDSRTWCYDGFVPGMVLTALDCSYLYNLRALTLDGILLRNFTKNWVNTLRRSPNHSTWTPPETSVFIFWCLTVECIKSWESNALWNRIQGRLTDLYLL